MILALTGGGEFSHGDGWAMHPPGSRFGCAEKRKGAGVEFDRKGQIRPSTGAGLNRCFRELPVFCRLRLTPYRPEPLRRSRDCLRGCFASLTQGP